MRVDSGMLRNFTASEFGINYGMLRNFRLVSSLSESKLWHAEKFTASEFIT